MASWLVPTTHWQAVSETDEILGRLAVDGELLVTWPPAPFESAPTYCYKIGTDFWIWQPAVGGARFAASCPELFLHPLSGTDLDSFHRLLWRSWIPTIYPIWNRQVLHASGVVSLATGDVIAFSGPSGAGKSTTAYGLSRRPGWALVADDTLAFEYALDKPRRPASLYPLRAVACLRPAAAEHFGKPDATEEPFEWPSLQLRLKTVYLLDGTVGLSSNVQFTELGAAESYPLLLGQAHAMTLQIAELNRRLMRDYLALAAGVSVFRVTYPKTFDRFETVLDQLEAHAQERGIVLDPPTRDVVGTGIRAPIGAPE